MSPSKPILVKLLPIIGVVFVSFLVIGIALPVLPLYVHDELGMSAFVVGLVAGSQFAAALLSRVYAGHHSDTQGAKKAVIVGLGLAFVSGLVYLLSLRYRERPDLSVSILIAGRALLGASESFMITGALSWGIQLAGPESTGRVMSWVGTSLWIAFAVAAPLGTALYTSYGFVAIAGATTVIPLAALILLAGVQPTEPRAAAPSGLRDIAGAVWVPGLALALAGVGFGAITTFITLLYSAHKWPSAWLAFTGLSLGFIIGRLAFGHLPDRIGGARVAFRCMLVEAVGLTLIWLSPSPHLALFGVTLAGLGYSLVYPSLGVEAIRRAPPASRGLAMGAYTAFLDLSLAVTSPILGLVASHVSLAAVFLVSAAVALGAAAIALNLANRDFTNPGTLASASNLP